jgi:hypothetical protein
MKIRTRGMNRPYYSVKSAEVGNEFIFVVQDSVESSRLAKQIMIAHFAAMAAFITICLAPVAWIFAAANIFLSPKAAFWHFHCTEEKITISRLYLRSLLADVLVPAPASLGPQVLGRGEVEEPISLEYSEIESVTWSGDSLEILFKDRPAITTQMNHADTAEITKLVEKVQSIIDERKTLPPASKMDVIPTKVEISMEKKTFEIPEKTEQPTQNEEELDLEKDVRVSPNVSKSSSEPSLEILLSKIKEESNQLFSNNNFEEYKGQIYSFSMMVERISPTFEFQLEEEYQRGQSLSGKVHGINIMAYMKKEHDSSLEIVVGKEIQIRASFYQWKSILQQVIVKIL